MPSRFEQRKTGGGITLTQLVFVLCLIAILIALLLPEVEKNNVADMQGKQKDGPYWVYREYEYAGGPVISEISGSYKHSLQEILDMYASNLKKQQKQDEQELLAEGKKSAPKTISLVAVPAIESGVTDPVSENYALDEFLPVEYTREEKIEEIKHAIKNFKFDLSQNTAPLVARRNLAEAIQLLEQDLKKLETTP